MNFTFNIFCSCILLQGDFNFLLWATALICMILYYVHHTCTYTDLILKCDRFTIDDQQCFQFTLNEQECLKSDGTQQEINNQTI